MTKLARFFLPSIFFAVLTARREVGRRSMKNDHTARRERGKTREARRRNRSALVLDSLRASLCLRILSNGATRFHRWVPRPRDTIPIVVKH